MVDVDGAGVQRLDRLVGADTSFAAVPDCGVGAGCGRRAGVVAAVVDALSEAVVDESRETNNHTPPATTSDGRDHADDDHSLSAGPLGRLAPGELPLELALGRVATLLVGGHALVLPHSLGWPAK